MGVGQLDYSSRKPSKTQSVFFLLGTHLEGFFDTDKVLSLHGHDVVSGQVEDAQALPEKVKAKPTKSTNAVCASSNSFEKKKPLPSTPSKLASLTALLHIEYRNPESLTIIDSENKTAKFRQPLNCCQQQFLVSGNTQYKKSRPKEQGRCAL